MNRILIACCAWWCGSCFPSGPAAPDYEAVFVTGRVVEWNIEVAASDWVRITVEPSSAPCQNVDLGPTCSGAADCPAECGCRAGICALQYVEADVTVEGVRYERVGLRVTGDRTDSKKELRVAFDEYRPEQRFHGVKQLDLFGSDGDPTLLRQMLALTLLRQAGVPAPRSSMIWLSVNGAPLGVYTLVEHVDKQYLQDRFGENDGNLYKLERGGTLAYEGDNPDAYEPPFADRYELKTNETVGDVSDLIALMKQLAVADVDERAAGLARLLDVDGYLLALAINSWLANMDSYPGATGNLYLYHDAAGRFRYIPWDLTRAFGNYHQTSCAHSTDDLLALDPDAPTCPGLRPLVTEVLGIAANQNLYHEHLAGLVDATLAPSHLLDEVTVLRSLIVDYAHQDTADSFAAEEFDASFTQDLPEGDNPVRVPGLAPFVHARDDRVRELMGAW